MLREARGAAVLPILLLMFLFAAIAVSAAAVVRLEILIADGYARAAEALAAAEAGVEMVLAELRPEADWTPLVAGTAQSPQSQGPFAGARRIGGGTVLLCCGPGSAMGRLESDTAESPLPSRRAVRWRPYLWTALSAVAPRVPPSRPFVVVWTGNDEEDPGGEREDTNGTLILRSEALEPGGARRIVEALVGRHPAAGGLYAASTSPEADRRQRVAILRWREVR